MEDLSSKFPAFRPMTDVDVEIKEFLLKSIRVKKPISSVFCDFSGEFFRIYFFNSWLRFLEEHTFSKAMEILKKEIASQLTILELNKKQTERITKDIIGSISELITSPEYEQSLNSTHEYKMAVIVDLNKFKRIEETESDTPHYVPENAS